MASPYEILGVSPDDTLDAAETAYHHLLRRQHPDLVGRAGTAPREDEAGAWRVGCRAQVRTSAHRAGEECQARFALIIAASPARHPEKDATTSP